MFEDNISPIACNWKPCSLQTQA